MALVQMYSRLQMEIIILYRDSKSNRFLHLFNCSRLSGVPLFRWGRWLERLQVWQKQMRLRRAGLGAGLGCWAGHAIQHHGALGKPPWTGSSSNMITSWIGTVSWYRIVAVSHVTLFTVSQNYIVTVLQYLVLQFHIVIFLQCSVT